MPVKKGDRVTTNSWAKQNAAGLADNPRRAAGTVLGESRDGLCWRVKWDGLYEVERWHKDYIRKVPT